MQCATAKKSYSAEIKANGIKKSIWQPGLKQLYHISCSLRPPIVFTLISHVLCSCCARGMLVQMKAGVYCFSFSLNPFFESLCPENSLTFLYLPLLLLLLLFLQTITCWSFSQEGLVAFLENNSSPN